MFALKERKCNEILWNKEVKMTQGRKATALKAAFSKFRESESH